MNPYVVAWTATALIGAALSLLLLVESLVDLHVLGDARNGRRIRVWGRLSQESVRLSVHLPFAWIGFGSLYVPVNPDSSTNILVLLWGNVAFILNSLIAMYVRRAAERSLPEEAVAAAAVLALQAEEAAEKIRVAALDARTLLNDDQRTAGATERVADATERVADVAEGKTPKPES